jgi:hypothetical protein
MRPPLRLVATLVGALVVVAIVALVLVIVAIDTRHAPTLAPISAIDYSQYQAVPDFPDATHHTSDPARIAAFTALVKKYSIDVTDFNESLNDDCTGGMATTLTLHFADSKTAKFRVYDCGGQVPRGTFVSDTSALVTRWRTSTG